MYACPEYVLCTRGSFLTTIWTRAAAACSLPLTSECELSIRRGVPCTPVSAFGGGSSHRERGSHHLLDWVRERQDMGE